MLPSKEIKPQSTPIGSPVQRSREIVCCIGDTFEKLDAIRQIISLSSWKYKQKSSLHNRFDETRQFSFQLFLPRIFGTFLFGETQRLAQTFDVTWTANESETTNDPTSSIDNWEWKIAGEPNQTNHCFLAQAFVLPSAKLTISSTYFSFIFFLPERCQIYIYT